jgi:hypothetical protein
MGCRPGRAPVGAPSNEDAVRPTNILVATPDACAFQTSYYQSPRGGRSHPAGASIAGAASFREIREGVEERARRAALAHARGGRPNRARNGEIEPGWDGSNGLFHIADARLASMPQLFRRHKLSDALPARPLRDRTAAAPRVGTRCRSRSSRAGCHSPPRVLANPRASQCVQRQRHRSRWAPKPRGTGSRRIENRIHRATRPCTPVRQSSPVGRVGGGAAGRDIE